MHRSLSSSPQSNTTAPLSAPLLRALHLPSNIPSANQSFDIPCGLSVLAYGEDANSSFVWAVESSPRDTSSLSEFHPLRCLGLVVVAKRIEYDIVGICLDTFEYESIRMS